MRVAPGEICVIQRGMRFRCRRFFLCPGAPCVFARSGCGRPLDKGAVILPGMRFRCGALVGRHQTHAARGGGHRFARLERGMQAAVASRRAQLHAARRGLMQPWRGLCSHSGCSVALPDGRARGYVLEVFAGHFQLPDLGPIGELPK